MLIQIEKENNLKVISPISIRSASKAGDKYQTTIIRYRDASSGVMYEPAISAESTNFYSYTVPLPYAVVIDALNLASQAGVAIADFSKDGIAQLQKIYGVGGAEPEKNMWDTLQVERNVKPRELIDKRLP